MRPISENTTGELRWLKPSRRKSDYELRAGDDLVATLTWTRGSNATGQTASATYRFSRQGWLRPRILVHEGDAAPTPALGEAIATFTQRGGALTFPDGRTFLWKKPKRWTNERIWADPAATELLRFSPSRTQTTVTITSSTAPELPLLILLGQYLLVLAQQDALVATTAAATVVATG
jgi:hypothetical protein